MVHHIAHIDKISQQKNTICPALCLIISTMSLFCIVPQIMSRALSIKLVFIQQPPTTTLATPYMNSFLTTMVSAANTGTNFVTHRTDQRLALLNPLLQPQEFSTDHDDSWHPKDTVQVHPYLLTTCLVRTKQLPKITDSRVGWFTAEDTGWGSWFSV